MIQGGIQIPSCRPRIELGHAIWRMRRTSCLRTPTLRACNTPTVGCCAKWRQADRRIRAEVGRAYFAEATKAKGSLYSKGSQARAAVPHASQRSLHTCGAQARLRRLNVAQSAMEPKGRLPSLHSGQALRPFDAAQDEQAPSTSLGTGQDKLCDLNCVAGARITHGEIGYPIGHGGAGMWRWAGGCAR